MYKNALQIIIILTYSVWSCSMMPWSILMVKEEGEYVMCLGESMSSFELPRYALNLSVVKGTNQLALCICTESNSLSSITAMSLSQLYEYYQKTSRAELEGKILCNFEMLRHPQSYTSINVPLKYSILEPFNLANPLHILIRINHTNYLEQPSLEYVLGLQKSITYCLRCQHSATCDEINYKCLCQPQYYGDYCQVKAAGELKLSRDSNTLSNPNSISSKIQTINAPLAIPKSSIQFIAIHNQYNETTNLYVLLSLNNSVTQTLKIVNSNPLDAYNFPSNLDSSFQLTIQPHEFLFLSVSKSTDTNLKLTSPVTLSKTYNFELINKTNCVIANLTLTYMDFFIVMNSTEILSFNISGSSQRDYLNDVNEESNNNDSNHQPKDNITLNILVYILIGTIGLSLVCLFAVSFQLTHKGQNNTQKTSLQQTNKLPEDQLQRQQQLQLLQLQQQQPLSTATHNILSNNNNNDKQDKYKILNSHKHSSIMDIESSTSSQLARHKNLPQLSSSLSSNSFTVFGLQQQEIFPMHIPSSSQTPIVSLNYSNSQPFQSQNLFKDLQKGQHSLYEQSIIHDSSNIQQAQISMQNESTNRNNFLQKQQTEKSLQQQQQQQQSPCLNQISQNLFQQISQGTDNNHLTSMPANLSGKIMQKELNFTQDNLNPEDLKNQQNPQSHSAVTFCPLNPVINEESKPLTDEINKYSPNTSANFFEGWLPSISLTNQRRPLVQTNTDLKLQSDLEPIIKEEAQSVDEYINGTKTQLEFQPKSVENSNQAVQIPKPAQSLKSERSGESSFSSDYHSERSNEQQQDIEGDIQKDYVHHSENDLNEEIQTGRVQILRKFNYDHDTVSQLNDLLSAEEIIRENSRNQNNPIVASSTAD